MQPENTERSHVSGPSAVERRVICLAEVEQYLREEADFNRSWTDGRRGADMTRTEEYAARRLEIARQRDEWADAIADAITALADNSNSTTDSVG